MSVNIEGIKDFIREHSKVVILSAAIVLLVCLLLIIVVAVASSGKESRQDARLSAETIPPEEFFLPDEPLPTPGIQLSRESEPAWSEEEAERWFVPPSKEDLDELRQLGEESVNRLLEAVP